MTDTILGAMPAAADIAEPLAHYLTERWSRAVAVTDVQQIPGGASRETFRIALDDNGKARGVILRRDPPTSLIDTERRHEYETYRAVFGSEVPVPEPLLLEEDASILSGAFSIMAEVPGCEAAPAALAEPPYAAVAPKIGERAWSLLGRLSRYEPGELGVDSFMRPPEHPARHELDYWSAVIAADSLHPSPIAAATKRWLERHLPAPSQRLCLVHGDFRAGNFLYNSGGEIKAVLDWEMAHLGDPLEDLAWSLDPLWGNDREIAGNLLPREDAIALWEKASGCAVDRDAFRWWQVFASYKGLAIWISSIEDFKNGASKDPILALAGWVMSERQSRILLDRIQPDSPHEWADPLV